MQKLFKLMSSVLIAALLLFDIAVPAARAQMVGTEALLSATAAEENRARVAAFLDREDVRQAMVQQGVDLDEARQRVASLSDRELAPMAQALEQLPAGGDGVGAVIGAAVLIFLVLLITDILGFTNVFNFVRPAR